MNYQQKYVKLLEEDLAQARKDLEFYRGKCERLEMTGSVLTGSVRGMDGKCEPIRFSYNQTFPLVEPDTKSGSTGSTGSTDTKSTLSFRELKERWMSMSAEEQKEAVANGWDPMKEESNAGS